MNPGSKKLSSRSSVKDNAASDLANNAVYVVDGLRTPFLKFQGEPASLSATDLAVNAIKPLLLRQPFSPKEIEEVIAGCVGPQPHEVNIARLIALRSLSTDQVMGLTVQRNCASGLQAIDTAAMSIAFGRYDLVLAGGTECMSRVPLFFRDEMAVWLAQLNKSKGVLGKARAALQFKSRYLAPQFGLLKALTDPIVNLSMGQTAEKVAYLFDVSREEMDEFSLRSHLRAKEATDNGYLEEITPLFDNKGSAFFKDTGIRESSLEKLATLKPVFDKPFGLVTAGNSSQVSDGAAFVILASKKAVQKFGLPILGRIVTTEWAALDPSVMGLGPVYAIQKLLNNNNLQLEDIDYWEINEAFAAQVLACLKALESTSYCADNFNSAPLGKIDPEKLNVDGGAISIGHPVGASGARLVLHLLHILKRKKAKRGIASLCIGGGQGGAMLIERLSDDEIETKR